MEMSDLKINYNIFTKVLKVEEGFEKVYVSGSGESAVFTKRSLGWFVTFEGSYESLFFGDEKPRLSVGKNVKITFMEIEDEAVQ